MKSIIAATTAVLLVAGSAAGLQGKPNFSGEWRADAGTAAPTGGAPGAAPATARGDMGSGWGPALTLRHDDQQLIVEDRIFSRYDMQPAVRLVYVLDGSESVNNVMLGHSTQRRASRAVWKDQTLEITTQYPGTHPTSGQSLATEVVQRLRLESPDVLVIEVTRQIAGAQPASTRMTYRKQTPKG